MSSDEEARFGMSVVTWNVWFEDYEFETRSRAIFDICACLSPDVICFQEVKPRFEIFLKRECWYSDYECSCDYFESSIEPYGVMMLCKQQLKPTFYLRRLDSFMDRQFLRAEMLFHKSTICIGTVHLESLNSREMRHNQLACIAEILRSYDNAILCGDFNFCSYRNFDLADPNLENDMLQEILPDFVDMWPVFWSNGQETDFGFTFDSVTNTMISHHEQMRYDRILYKFERSEMGKAIQSRFWPASIQLIGRNRIAESASDCRGRTTEGKSWEVFPSDHFGLIAAFELMSPKHLKSPGECVLS